MNGVNRARDRFLSEVFVIGSSLSSSLHPPIFEVCRQCVEGQVERLSTLVLSDEELAEVRGKWNRIDLPADSMPEQITRKTETRETLPSDANSPIGAIAEAVS